MAAKAQDYSKTAPDGPCNLLSLSNVPLLLLRSVSDF